MLKVETVLFRWKVRTDFEKVLLLSCLKHKKFHFLGSSYPSNNPFEPIDG